MGDWKLVQERGSDVELFNLKDDISEKTDLAAKEPAKLKELQASYDVRDRQMMPAQWVRQDGRTQGKGKTAAKDAQGGNVSVWFDEDAPAQPHAFTERAYLAGFSIDTPFITWSPRLRAGDRSTTQVSLLDTGTSKAHVITADDGAKYDPWLWHAPEFDGELLLCVNLDERALAIYRDTQRDGQSTWPRIAEIRLPADAPHPQLKSCEPVNGGHGAFGRSWFTAQSGEDNDPDTSIWLLGFDLNGRHIVRRLDEGVVTGKPARRLDPESLVGDRELFVYYTLVGDGSSQLHRRRGCIDGSLGNPRPALRDQSSCADARFIRCDRASSSFRSSGSSVSRSTGRLIEASSPSGGSSRSSRATVSGSVISVSVKWFDQHSACFSSGERQRRWPGGVVPEHPSSCGSSSLSLQAKLPSGL
jgi:hypothetical protein